MRNTSNWALIFALVARHGNVLALATSGAATTSECTYETEVDLPAGTKSISLYYQSGLHFICEQGRKCLSEQVQNDTFHYVSTEPLNKWTAGGLPVSQSIEFGKSCSCVAQHGQTACVWVNIPYLQYIVHNTQKGAGCEKPGKSKPIMVRSPLTHNDKGCFCEPDPDVCKHQDYNFWETATNVNEPAKLLENHGGSGPFPNVKVHRDRHSWA